MLFVGFCWDCLSAHAIPSFSKTSRNSDDVLHVVLFNVCQLLVSSVKGFIQEILTEASGLVSREVLPDSGEIQDWLLLLWHVVAKIG